MSIYKERFADNSYDEDDYYRQQPLIVNGKKAEKIRNDSSKHYPNKDEAQELRKIMASTGLSEEEVRQDPKHRLTLAEARKVGEKPKNSADVKWYREMIKRACKQTGLVPQHPKTIAVLDGMLKGSIRTMSVFHNPMYLKNMKSAEEIVNQYAKK